MRGCLLIVDHDRSDTEWTDDRQLRCEEPPNIAVDGVDDASSPLVPSNGKSAAPTTEAVDVERIGFRTVIKQNGYQYTKMATSMRTISYRCSFYRCSTKCKGRVEYHAHSTTFALVAPHTCQTYAISVSSPIVNTEEAMKAHVDELAVKDMGTTAEAI